MANYYVTKDTRIARRESDNWDSGSGSSDGLPTGLYNGYRYRILLGFSINMSGWTAINSATLHYRTSNQIHVAHGSNPKIKWQRITTSWSEGSSSGLSASNSTIYPGPSVSGTNDVQDDIPTGENDWTSIGITAMMRDVLGGSPFYGIRGMATDASGLESDSSTNVGEIYSRESGYDAYIEIDYETNTGPTVVPTLVGAVGNVVNDTTPDISLAISDAQGDSIASYTIDIDDSSDVTSPFHTQTVVGPWTSPATRVHTSPALTRGVPYYVRVRATDSKGLAGPYATLYDWKVAQLPVVTVTEPSATGRIGKITYDPGQGWASPRLNVNWNFTCPDGGTQSTYRVEVLTDAAGAPSTPLYDSTALPGSAIRAVVVPSTLTEGAYYHVRVTCVCSHGASTVSATYRIRVRWGVVTHAYTTGGGALTLNVLDVTDETAGGAGRVVMEYATNAGGAPSAWFASVAAAGSSAVFHYRAWLLAYGASPAVSPTLNELKVTYSASVIIPDKWTRLDVVNQGGSKSAYVYGTQSMRLNGKGSLHSAYQEVPLNTDTWYVLSGRIQSQGASGAYIAIASGTSVPAPALETDLTNVVVSEPETESGDFSDTVKSRAVTVPFFSGSNSSAFVRVAMTGPSGTAAWFDALKLEASTVVTPWSPGYIADAVVLDSGGLQIDGLAGGIFRLRGNLGGTRDEVVLSDHGLRFGGDAELSSPSPGVLAVNGTPLGSTSPVTNIYTANGTWVRPAGLAYILVEVTGGGGAGGGVPAPAASQMALGAGGGGGGYARKRFTAADLTTLGVLVGNGCAIVRGAGGVGDTNAGDNGQSSSFTAGATVVAGYGGVGGATSTSGTSAATELGGSGGSGNNGDINITGGDGFNSVRVSGTQGGMLGNGGGSAGPYGGGVSKPSGANAGGPGGAGNAYGGGGPGGWSKNNGAQAGGSGAAGIVVVTEYY